MGNQRVAQGMGREPFLAQLCGAVQSGSPPKKAIVWRRLTHLPGSSIHLNGTVALPLSPSAEMTGICHCARPSFSLSPPTPSSLSPPSFCNIHGDYLLIAIFYSCVFIL